MMNAAAAWPTRDWWRWPALMLVAAALFVLASPAHAAVVPLSVVATNPVDGASVAPVVYTSPLIPVSITTSGIPTSVFTIYVEVSTQNVPGQDGTLADDYRVDFVGLNRSDANPAVFSGNFNALLWATKPGTYYWQASATVVNSGGFGLDTLESPVYTIVVTSPPAPPVVVVPSPPPPAPPPAVDDSSGGGTLSYRMTLSDAAYDAAFVISKHDAAGGHLKRSCTRIGRTSFKCTVSWRDLRFAFAGTLRLTDKGLGTIRSSFAGLRAKLSCLKLRGAKACARPMRW